MARLNARQKRAMKRRLSLGELARDKNPSMVADSGHMRSSTNGNKGRLIDETYFSHAQGVKLRPVEDMGKKPRKAKKLWGERPPVPDFIPNGMLFQTGVSNPTSLNAPKDIVPTRKAKPRI